MVFPDVAVLINPATNLLPEKAKEPIWLQYLPPLIVDCHQEGHGLARACDWKDNIASVTSHKVSRWSQQVTGKVTFEDDLDSRNLVPTTKT